MKIGISGASGHLGQAVLAELAVRAQGHDLVAISRTPEKVAGEWEKRAGDYDNPEMLAQAYAGLDRLLLIPTVDLAPGARSRQNAAAIEAAAAAGVGHVVFLSAAGTARADDTSIHGSYWRGEQTLIQRARAWTILRMNYYVESFAMEVAAPQTSQIFGLAENKVAFISRNDIAAAAAGMLISKGHDGAIYNLTGPQSLTGAERAATASKITGREISFQIAPEAALRVGFAQFGYPEIVIDAVIDIQKKFAAGGNDIVTGDVEKLAGRPARPLVETLGEALRALS
ncbi:MAG: SDR family NAD(P)-dependent oxidoreductase [Mesorhizobium sp.]|uniref:NAD(P)H-binding protein n=1 Tax=unclassified Mesorhizobium TaxID=325217 RepID=UPI000FCA9E42|nr:MULTISPECIES: NAD(P)H-binding protein [unclassified Mesorhizobium]RUV68771.1 SDR family NAD(P)-dependent oxidoreductase [Mesorhizobium sp. M5C.F.Cr.IN.023.01.1.1]RWF87363.1 MAG: SDR family NAD(P)-dependent oxidoreductase [Mesorhizobium sp.]RWF91710.1 MAG: SDR family NAD(P)-dependent oxidoreductase [Mesorhizobium sp.]RWI33756.1 MAG: SDR family NAD(P)-dependent oxidoreductase [Mesorhizobium sp.]RWI44773.1 MAG: SDR family NAD(P)-dependent oxidoreductase [Mesorhizobium sp.]